MAPDGPLGPLALAGISCRQAYVSSSPVAFPSCVTAHGYLGYLIYQPASRFWAFQGIEAGIYLTVAAALIAVTFYAVSHKDA